MAQIRKRHHAVPIHYLRRFTAANGLIWVYPLYSGEPKQIHPRNAAVERFLYSPKTGDKPHDDTLEQVLADCVDGPAAPSLEKLIRGDDILPEDRAAIALYIALQELRVPAFRDQLRANLEQILRVIVDLLMEHPTYLRNKAREYGEDPENVVAGLQGIQEGSLELQTTKTGWLQNLFMIARDTGPLIARLPWLVVEAPPQFEFVTSDCPVVKILTDRSVPALYAGGWVSPSAEATLILDPEHALVISPGGKEGRSKGRLSWCHDVNSRTVTQANRYVYSRSQAEWIARAIQKESEPVG